jgi:GNAT superfamily N-acetyltransferase
MMKDGERAGILELDFASTPGECEIAFFGVTPKAIGSGAGRYLMNEAIARAWSRPITRLWVHTCTHDHPSALAFYIRSGFTPYQRMIEIHDDPRVQGHLPETASPHIPLIKPR